jgi:hypothetical protein
MHFLLAAARDYSASFFVLASCCTIPCCIASGGPRPILCNGDSLVDATRPFVILGRVTDASYFALDGGQRSATAAFFDGDH